MVDVNVIQTSDDFGLVINFNVVFVQLVTNVYVGEQKKNSSLRKTFLSSQANRCYKYYSTPKNHSAAREDCRKDQADLFSWRNNDDETELITASTENSQAVKYQTYSWGGGIIYQGRGK